MKNSEIFPIPKSLCVLLIILLLVAIFAVVAPYIGSYSQTNLESFALIITFGALLVYTYYTGVQAEWSIRPSASAAIIQITPGSSEIRFFIKSHTKLSLRCWCTLQLTIDGKNSEFFDEGFYGGKTPWDLQPYGDGCGQVYDIQNIVKNEGIFYVDLRKKVEDKPFPIKTMFQIKLNFRYHPIGSSHEVTNPSMVYYYDLKRDVLVLDV